LQSVKQAANGRLRRVEGRHNALVKELRQAFRRGELTPTGECAIEGVRVIEDAIRSGLRIRAVFVSESGRPRAAGLLPQIGSHTETLLLPDALFAGAVSTETPQGVAALVAVKKYTLAQILDESSHGPWLFLAGIQDPGNLGTILRSAEAFGVAGVLLGEGTVSVYNSKAIRASAGSAFRVPVSKAALHEAIPELRSRGARLVATSSHKGTPLREARFSGRLAVVIGNEGSGLDKKLLAQMDLLITIPHSPKVESLNAGVAASIVLYEIMSQG
jgi:TrmH family RNA methyltransferase